MRSQSRAARIASILALTALVKAEGISERNTSPFFPAVHALNQNAHLLPRQSTSNNGNCPTNAHSCASISYPGFCCPNTAQCALDNAGHIACCPNGIYCVGTVAQEGNNCNKNYYACPENLFSGGCCLSGYEYCSKNRCIVANDAIASVVSAVPGLITSAVNGGIGVYRTGTNTAGAIVTQFVGDAGAVYSSYIADPAGAASSFVDSALTAISTGFPVSVDPNVVSTVRNGGSGVVSVITGEYSDFRSDLGGWYTSFTSRYGSGYTSYLNQAGQYVTTIETVVNGVPTETAVTVQFPAFVQSQPTKNAAPRAVSVGFVRPRTGGERGGSVMGMLWVWTVGLGLFTAVVGWL
ncbi:hypothetical protein AA313_de0202245 [Arthrobotrys entomopaga]|nr:hypothetical protein AA313_de0202245 [Arthrobotrys entomopaga]